MKTFLRREENLGMSARSFREDVGEKGAKPI